MSQSYRSSGVDMEAGYRAVDLIKKRAKLTARPEVLSSIGGFNAMFSIAAAKNMERPALVTGTDGVGTKLKVAFLLDKHDTIGQDCVAMCVNDIVCSGAEPLFFLDYIACDKIVPSRIDEIAKGIADGCALAGAALIGGETAEMPGFYHQNEYDLSGFVVGLVDYAAAFDKSSVRVGDKLIGIGSNGVHSNGYSLIRKMIRLSEENLSEYILPLGCTLGEELIRPTKIYAKLIMEIKPRVNIKSLCNITGGGFVENVPRMLPPGCAARIYKGSWPVLPVFDILRSVGGVHEAEMYNVFNMGIGMVAAVSPDEEKNIISVIKEFGETCYSIGEVIAGEGAQIC
ncbi:MAG: phosphoribosylformylglycinamidine cyclo-ligase [Clostridiales bacterium]|jgi:phosphoribosylformylglycinamidine cyclo-ligase|nr:phosphoribosylformylglycinamidine cyclo-ligase [Clostridiales bacterium]